ncbi:MAG: hypothetical protein ACQEWU_01845 [Bacillota bacterium]|uniref:Uncharacterized protein n=1 Tax=Virgibacillus salarius TaxID=447199 RepID=A0A941DYG8_9BACI|nr:MULTISPECIES: hypothetical protein [Bacillaceae]NAZ10625.1 hypothetical protein [Agaribacter marinus]MBR7797917.1 hypothetical protein [Virgibacillus salarius]MCC2248485.1 hypothetical protein [Virgibacillus sp. AGTR]MDY7043080.1 hypothetical protein [Virgibacillus sp. M23]QRZ16652.1 hypothetical protein JUJ52_12650 [Virgibacillus sp. AGTR]
MLSNPLIATALIFALIALGEWLSIISRARIPMLLTAMVGFLVCVWTGIFPEDILEKSQFAALGAILVGPAILHMGTMIPLSLLRSQVKAVLIALGGVIVSGIIILVIVSLMFDYGTAVAGVGPLSGGIIALLITSEELASIGRSSLVVIPALIVAFQGLFGMPLALNFMRKYAVKIQNQLDNGTFVPMANEVAATKEKTKASPLRESAVLKLFYIFIGAAIGTTLGEVTPIHATLWCLAIGIAGLKIGIFETKTLEKANSFTITMIAIVFVVIGTMADVTPQEVLANLPSILLILILGTFGIALGGFIVSKLVKWDPLKGMPVALTALFGFPGDYLLCEEVSRSAARNEEEEKIIFNELLAPMLIGGFTTVTVASVVIAGFLVQTL